MSQSEAFEAGSHQRPFRTINKGYSRLFKPGQLSVGLVVPIESYPGGAVPSMDRHIERVQIAEALGFSAVWLRDVPFNVPAFGDAGQTFDPFVYLGTLAGQTRRIALGVSSIILPLRLRLMSPRPQRPLMSFPMAGLCWGSPRVTVRRSIPR